MTIFIRALIRTFICPLTSATRLTDRLCRIFTQLFTWLSTRRSRTKSYPDSFYCVFLLCFFTCCTATAQTPEELDRLIFDPVVIDENSGAEIRASSVPIRFLSKDSAANDITPEQTLDNPGISPLEIIRNIDRYKVSLRNLEEAGGPFSPDLYQPLLDLGSQHQLLGDHETAIEVFQRAEHISRVNHGLYHPNQVDSINKLISSYIAIGDLSSASEKRRYLLLLSEEYYGSKDPEIVPILVNLAEHNMANYSHMMDLTGTPVTSFTTGTPYAPFEGRQATPGRLAFDSLVTAKMHYKRAISTMINNEQFFDPLILDLESRLLETLLLQAFRPSILEDPDYYLSDRSPVTGSLIKRDFNRRGSNGYSEGKKAFERVLIYLRHNPQTKAYQMINALLEYGDWDMLFNRGYSAMKKYREAYALIQQLQINQNSIDQVFRPALPVHLPLITAKPNSREKFDIPESQELDYQGYIDVAFTISKFGKAKKFDIQGTTGKASRDIERRLLRYLRNSPFRPYINEDGSFTDRRLTLRYYFTYAAPADTVI